MKNSRFAAVIAVVLLTLASPSTLLAQSWWEGFANAPQSNSFWSWLQQHPNMAGPLQQNPYQIYDPGWRAQHPEFQQYINNNPGWWNSIRAGGSKYYDESFSRFLGNHPGVARQLRQNPDLIYDPAFRARHPDLKEYLASHKNVWRAIKNQRYAYSPKGGWGSYNSNKQWRDETWWKDNGDWDQHKQWHDREWWEKNNRALAEQRHPNWFENKPKNMPPGQMKHQRGRGPDHGDHGNH
jgi:hypothetical protein